MFSSPPLPPKLSTFCPMFLSNVSGNNGTWIFSNPFLPTFEVDLALCFLLKDSSVSALAQILRSACRHTNGATNPLLITPCLHPSSPRQPSQQHSRCSLSTASPKRPYCQSAGGWERETIGSELPTRPASQLPCWASPESKGGHQVLESLLVDRRDTV
jgi:hypothetical protein